MTVDAPEVRRLRAIDLYAGVGGWSLGLSLAGIEVVASYDWWAPACRTNRANGGHAVMQRDIRSLDLEELPKGIDIVVGSPPCTQFSLANRGGSGDMNDGVRDLRAFLRVVAHLRPRYWVFENVVRAAQVFEREVRGGSLAEFSWLEPRVHIIDASRFGVPQRRNRALVGNIDFGLLESYTPSTVFRTLGYVIAAVEARGNDIADPTWGWRYAPGTVTDAELEVPLTAQETRLNRDAKANNPVYNGMAFPDDLDRPSRTITATCTRVSRESIVVEVPGKLGTYRRLSVRERAALQGFPLWFQFLGESHAQKLKLVGNAVPPPLTYLVGQAIKGVAPGELPSTSRVGRGETPPTIEGTPTMPDVPPKTYRSDRSFAAAIPHLRFKSGTRFEISNRVGPDSRQAWACRFYWGSSRDVRSCAFDSHSFRQLVEVLAGDDGRRCLSLAAEQAAALALSNLPDDLQVSWTRGSGSSDAHVLVDQLGEVAQRAGDDFERACDGADLLRLRARVCLLLAGGDTVAAPTIPRKIQAHSTQIAAGIAVAVGVNDTWGVVPSLALGNRRVFPIATADKASLHLVQAALAI